MRSTGNLHFGNYFGAVKQWLLMQQSHTCFFFIADYHSLTTHPQPEALSRSIYTVLAEYLACGIDPEKATLYVQSDVPEIAELYLLLNMNAYLGELERTTTFKEKARKQPDNVNAGLLTYPVLMAADILIHRAHEVPVGKDQEQNLEMARQFAKRFNRMYKTDLFPAPKPFRFHQEEELIKIPGLDGTGKMGKSEGNAIHLIDSPDVIRKKVMRAVTDSGPTQPNQEKPEVIQNLFMLLRAVSSPETVAALDGQYKDCTIRYSDLKKQLAEDIISYIAPVRERILEFSAKPNLLREVAEHGAAKAKKSAQATLKEVRQLIGFPS